MFARLVPANLDPVHNSIDVSLEHCFLHSMRSLIVHLHQPAAAKWVLSIGRHKNNFLTSSTRKHKWDCSANGAELVYVLRGFMGVGAQKMREIAK